MTIRNLIDVFADFLEIFSNIKILIADYHLIPGKSEKGNRNSCQRSRRFMIRGRSSGMSAMNLSALCFAQRQEDLGNPMRESGETAGRSGAVGIETCSDAWKSTGLSPDKRVSGCRKLSQ
ncbi:MAG: hypothetical protein LBQ79_13135 [Deltaproteobacteria bacterium]|jgi:hypothetical protein|nr:hypothetical protein [Deltaproteobacteria bacterium]